MSQNRGLRAGSLGNCLTHSVLQLDLEWICWWLRRRVQQHTLPMLGVVVKLNEL